MKHECDSATINIYLQDVQENAFIKVTREFDTQDRTHWKLNGNRCNAAQVQECIKKFNIQVRIITLSSCLIFIYIARNSFIVALISFLLMLGSCHFDINVGIYLASFASNTECTKSCFHKP